MFGGTKFAKNWGQISPISCCSPATLDMMTTVRRTTCHVNVTAPGLALNGVAKACTEPDHT